MTIDQIRLSRPDDWHLHLRDGEALRAVLPHSARRFARAIIMPNLKPPITTVDQARAYRRRILDALPPELAFEPLMTLYLTETTDAAEIARAKASSFVHGVKLYPAGATTHSDAGVGDLQRVTEALEAMEEHDLPLLVHGETTDPAVDIFDREAVFIERHLRPLVQRFPRLRVVLEHVTTAEGVDFVRGARAGVAATVTPQHLLMNRNAMLAGGIRPHVYCLPVLKRERHRQALLEAATSGEPRFFLGTDSAPHPQSAKQSACGCAGVFSAHAALEFYAEAFDEAGALGRLEGFASHFGADFYGLPRNEARLTLVRRAWTVERRLALGEEWLVPLRGGDTVAWRIAETEHS